MVFTPPPSPLSPRHTVRADPKDAQVTTQGNAPALSLAPPIPKLLTSSNTRRALVILTPLLLILIAVSSEIASTLSKGLVLYYSEHFPDAPSLRTSAGLDVSYSLGRRRAARHRTVASSYSPPTVDVGSRDSSDTAVSLQDEDEAEEHPHPTKTFEEGVQFDADPTNVAPPIDTTAPLPTPFPQPWDTSLSYNFTSASCLSFFADQLANITFRECRPFGLLFGYSSDFLTSEANLTLLSATLYGTCNTPQSQEQCISVMDWMSANMDDPKVCGKDRSLMNSVVLEAKGGFDEYVMMREVGCLVNNQTNAYCFAEAVANSTPYDAYYYNLALGTPLPRTTVPSCGTCTQSVMRIFAQYAGNANYDVSQTYARAANLSNTKCGSGYVPVVNTPKRTGGAGRRVWAFESGMGGMWVILSTCLVLVGSPLSMLFS